MKGKVEPRKWAIRVACITGAIVGILATTAIELQSITSYLTAFLLLAMSLMYLTVLVSTERRRAARNLPVVVNLSDMRVYRIYHKDQLQWAAYTQRNRASLDYKWKDVIPGDMPCYVRLKVLLQLRSGEISSTVDGDKVYVKWNDRLTGYVYDLEYLTYPGITSSSQLLNAATHNAEVPVEIQEILKAYAWNRI